MCGILFQVGSTSAQLVADNEFKKMLGTLGHRGPDGESMHRRGRELMGHRRLSIIDIAGGTQPLFNEVGDVACILNGEIYNYVELKERLKQSGHSFRTNSDTEVIVHLYEEYGPDFVQHLDGMFGLAIADFRCDRYLVARDRLGEKPVYFSESEGRITCASEARALLAGPWQKREVNRTALAGFLARGFIAGSASIWSGIRKLGPGQMMLIEAGQSARVETYWRPVRHAEKRSHAELVRATRLALERSIENKMVADVPVGVFLSGGLDSSVVTALAAKSTGRKLRTFSVGFSGAHSELPFAREVAERYKTDHTEIELALDLENDLPQAFAAYDEPFFDSSALPTFLVSREAARFVKVVLTGDGGDELFGGYSAYLDQAVQYKSRLLSAASRRILKKVEGSALASLVLNLPIARPSTRESLTRWRGIRGVFDQDQIGRLLGTDLEAVLSDSNLDSHELDRTPLDVALMDDLTSYLPDNLLVKVDRASMANGLECRAPLLDHHLVEFMLTVQSESLVAGGVTKALFREVARDLLPESILSREKRGFGSPLVAWIRGPLRTAIDSLTSRDSVLREILVPEELDAVVSRLLAELETNWRAPIRLWTLLSLQSWAELHLKPYAKDIANGSR